ncbi:MAG: rhodanese-like domain-containing protein [Solirubrobacterales bacterium]
MRSAAQMLADAKGQVEEVSPQEASVEAASGPVVFLDVREPVEWEHFIPGAVQVPRGLLEFAADPVSPRHKPELDPASRVVVYCRSGARGALAAATLKELGFEKVANLQGGFAAWKDAGLPTDEHHGDL